METPERCEYRWVYPVVIHVDGFGKVVKMFGTLADRDAFLVSTPECRRLHRRKEWVLI